MAAAISAWANYLTGRGSPICKNRRGQSMFARCQLRLPDRCWITGSWMSAGFSAIIAMALTGCVTTTHIVGQMNGPTARVQTKTTGAQSYSDAGPVSAEEAVGTDPCEMHLENIEAALLLYYSLKAELPQRLEDLASLSSDDLILTCPVSHQEYLYIRGGLPIPASKRVIIVADATPAHKGMRWCITMAPATPGAALELEPEELPESIFRGFQPKQ
jgi:hypothetical protein